MENIDKNEKKYKRITMSYYASRDFMCRRFHSFSFENYEDKKFDNQDFEPILRFKEDVETWFKQDVFYIEMPSIFGEKDLPELEKAFNEALIRLKSLNYPLIILWIWGDDHNTKYEIEKDFHDFKIPFDIHDFRIDGNIAYFKSHKIPFYLIKNIKRLVVHKFHAELNLKEISEYFDIKEGELLKSIPLEDFRIDIPEEFSHIFKLTNKIINIDNQHYR